MIFINYCSHSYQTPIERSIQLQARANRYAGLVLPTTRQFFVEFNVKLSQLVKKEMSTAAITTVECYISHHATNML